MKRNPKFKHHHISTKDWSIMKEFLDRISAEFDSAIGRTIQTALDNELINVFLVDDEQPLEISFIWSNPDLNEGDVVYNSSVEALVAYEIAVNEQADEGERRAKQLITDLRDLADKIENNLDKYLEVDMFDVPLHVGVEEK